MSAEKIHIIGVGDDALEGLGASVRALIDRAEVLIGSQQTLRGIPADGKQVVTIGSDLSEVVTHVEAAAGRRVAVLASGDPLFYGIARFLCDRLGKDRFEVAPNVSSMQLAFARVKESWEDAYLTNLATQPLERVIDAVRIAEKVGFFTSETVTPAVVASELLSRKIGYFSAYVCENLGSPDERVTQGTLEEIASLQFAPLNVMILVRMPDVPDRASEGESLRLFGNPDDRFLQSKPKYGLLTPSEIRSMALAEMQLQPSAVVWDIGAGSGSVAIEAAQIVRDGNVFAIEMDPDDYQLILANAARFGVANVRAILGHAPDAWKDLPDPDAVFVGGSGRTVCGITCDAYDRLKPGGRIVVSVGSIDNIAALHEELHKRSGDVQVWMINLARGTYQLERVRFEALNPSFLVAATKPHS